MHDHDRHDGHCANPTPLFGFSVFAGLVAAIAAAWWLLS